MAVTTVHTCDVCAAPVGAKRWEFDGSIAAINGKRSKAKATVECCSEQCLLKAVTGLMRKVEDA